MIMNFRTLTHVLVITAFTMAGREIRSQNTNANQEPAKSKNSTQAADKGEKMFVFEGGTLDEFINYLDKEFHVNIRERATLTVPVLTRVPKIRMPIRSVLDVFQVYDALAREGFPEIGSWYWQGSFSDGLPDVIALTSRNNNLSNVKIRAFTMKGLSDRQRDAMIQSIKEAAAILEMDQYRPSLMPGGFRMSPATDLLLVYGSESFLSAADTVVQEYRRSLVEYGEKQ